MSDIPSIGLVKATSQLEGTGIGLMAADHIPGMRSMIAAEASATAVRSV